MAFRNADSLGTRDYPNFRGWHNAAHTFACLRIAISVAEDVARLATEVVGCTFLGRDLHPLDDEPNFRSYRITSSFRTSFPGRFQRVGKFGDLGPSRL